MKIKDLGGDQCLRCEVPLAPADAKFTKAEYEGYCRRCRKRMATARCMRRQAAENKVKIRKIKEAAGCQHCGIEDHRVLQFHHVGKKELHIAQAMHRGVSWKKLEKEIERCIVLCANCHIIEHDRLKLAKGKKKSVSNRKKST